MTGSVAEELAAAEEAFNQAMINNDPDAIAACITPDWVLVTPERGPASAEAVLGAIASGILSHDSMCKTICHIDTSEDFATVTGRGQNTGHFMGEPMQADEWITDVYRRVDGRWRCTLTHLTPVAGPQQ